MAMIMVITPLRTDLFAVEMAKKPHPPLFPHRRHLPAMCSCDLTYQLTWRPS
jgi:hypothetical protein